MTVLDLPTQLEITRHAITLADNAGQAVLPFSGTVQRLAATFERLTGTWSFQPPRRVDSLAVESFFLRVGSGRALFRTRAYQPARNNPTMGGTVAGDQSARQRTLSVTGFPPSREIAAGEWVQVGWQAARVMAPVFTDAAGAADLDLFPMLHADVSNGARVQVGREVKILWRLVGDPPALAYLPSRHNSLEVSLSAIQEIVTGSHALVGEEVPA